MKLKKFLFSSLMLTSLFSEVVESSLVYNNNKSNIYKTTIHKQNGEEAINSAVMKDYGLKLANAKGFIQRKQRLTLTFTKSFYNLLLIVVLSNQQSLFLKYIEGEKAPFSQKEIWKWWHNELINTCEKTSAKYHLAPNFFYDLFINWLTSKEGWGYFKNVFVGHNLRNNLYNMPQGYNEESAQEQFRREGIIIQFYFAPNSWKSNEWKIYPICRAYPQNLNVESLKFYYTSFDTIHSPITRFASPFIKFDITKKPEDMSVLTLWKLWIKPAIEWSFNIPLNVVSKNLISLGEQSLKDKVSTDPLHPTSIVLNFHSGETGRIYKQYPIKLVAHLKF